MLSPPPLRCCTETQLPACPPVVCSVPAVNAVLGPNGGAATYTAALTPAVPGNPFTVTPGAANTLASLPPNTYTLVISSTGANGAGASVTSTSFVGELLLGVWLLSAELGCRVRAAATSAVRQQAGRHLDRETRAQGAARKRRPARMLNQPLCPPCLQSPWASPQSAPMPSCAPPRA